ncbi:MAG: hypothetical protein ACFCBV_05820 [Phycisphaerales bacterium]
MPRETPESDSSDLVISDGVNPESPEASVIEPSGESDPGRAIAENAVRSFQEDVYGEFTDIKKQIVDLQSEVKQLKENRALRKELTDVNTRLISETEKIQADLSRLSEAFGAHDQTTREEMGRASTRIDEVRETIGTIEKRLTSVSAELDTNVVRVEASVEKQLGHFNASVNEKLSRVERNFVRKVEQVRRRAEDGYASLGGRIDGSLDEMQRELQDQISLNTERFEDDLSQIRSSNQEDRLALDKKVNEVITYLKSQHPLQASENERRVLQLREFVHKAVEEAEANFGREISALREQSESARKYIITTLIAVIATAVSLMALIFQM